MPRDAEDLREVRPARPAGVEYRLSHHGHSVAPLVDAVRAWGREHLADLPPR